MHSCFCFAAQDLRGAHYRAHTPCGLNFLSSASWESFPAAATSTTTTSAAAIAAPTAIPASCISTARMAVAVTASVTETYRAAIDGCTGEIAATIGHTHGAVALQFLALRVINKPIRNAQLGVEGEKKWKPGRVDRIDAFVLAAMPPHAAKTFVALAMPAEHHRRRMMREAAECAATEAVVFAGIQDELMPEVIGDLRRH
jgi:hypothetical protein